LAFSTQLPVKQVWAILKQVFKNSLAGADGQSVFFSQGFALLPKYKCRSQEKSLIVCCYVLQTLSMCRITIVLNKKANEIC